MKPKRSRAFSQITFAAALFVACFTGAVAAAAERQHALSILSTPKYAPDFSHFDYVNPDAPKGGSVTLWYNGSFDSLNPFILKGRPAAGNNPFLPDGRLLSFETLMEQAMDEPSSYYGLIAEAVQLADDAQSIRFFINPKARFHDGSAITAEDVAFSLTTLKEKGNPIFAVLYRDVEKVEIEARLTIRFDFAVGAVTRDLPGYLAALPILSKTYYQDHDFTKTTLEPPLGSGPYKVAKVDEGRSITYERVRDHWAGDLPVYRGRYNFDSIRYDYYRDRDIALEAFFAGSIDFRQEYTSRSWATKYDVPPVNDGRITRTELPDGRPSGFQAFYLNQRRAKFADPRVRRAVGLMFDFEWSNKNLFYGAYRRTHSVFQNSDLEATGEPSKGELALLEPYRAELPEAVFGPAYKAVATKGDGRIRQQIREAKGLLEEAGWRIQDGVMVDQDNKPFEIEFLSFSRSFERIILPYVKNLERIGIKATFRLIEPAQYQQRMLDFDFDITTFRFSLGLTPGISLRNFFGSQAADTTGSNNYAGIKSPVVDALLERLVAAQDRDALRDAARALDRVVMAEDNFVPQWYSAVHRVAFWDMFARPEVKPEYELGFLDTWWVDSQKATRLDRQP